MTDWLKKRLTPPKTNELRWTELAHALEQIWEEFFDPEFSRLERLRSPYLADDADLFKKIREMGDYFSFDWPKKDTRPVGIAWRKLELEYKDLETIIISIFRRHFGNLPVAWFPIFAPKDDEYGTVFVPAQGPWPERKNIPPDNMFLTSRGRLGTDYSYLMSTGFQKQVFLDKALPLLMRTKPLHIVYDGPLWYIRFDFFFESAPGTSWLRDCGIFNMQFSIPGSHFDLTPADTKYLDIETALCKWERSDSFEIEFCPQDQTWHLDYFLPPSITGNWLPQDIIIPGNERASRHPLSLAADICKNIPLFDWIISKLEISAKKETGSPVYMQCPQTEMPVISENNCFLPFCTPKWHLDQYVSEVPDGWDAPDLFSGFENQKSPVLFARNTRHFSQIPFENIKPEINTDSQKTFPAAIDTPAMNHKQEKTDFSIFDSFCSCKNLLDMHPHFDDFCADIFPLDMPIAGGAYA